MLQTRNIRALGAIAKDMLLGEKLQATKENSFVSALAL